MIESFLTRALALILGYAYPTYECLKTVELNRPEIEQLLFWCQYWILVAALTVFERVGDAFISWMPMYSEAKVAFFVYLWYPKMRGTTYIYETFLRPYVASHENEIDGNLLELKARAGDMIVFYWQKAAIYGQTRIFEIFQYIASQAPQQQTRSRPTVRQPQAVHQTDQAPPAPSASNGKQPAATPQQPLRSPQSPAKRMSQEPTRATTDPLPAAPPLPQQQQQPEASSLDSTSQPSSTSDGEVKKISATAATETAVVAAEDPNCPAEATPIEEAIRITRGRLRKRAGFAPPAEC